MEEAEGGKGMELVVSVPATQEIEKTFKRIRPELNIGIGEQWRRKRFCRKL
jgi:hypothetical protein